MVKQIDIFQGLFARFCHDLSGTVGTIDNCTGLIDNENEKVKNTAKELINLESNNLINKIRFFRSVYGSIPTEKEISIILINKIIKDYLYKKNIKFNVNVNDGLISINVDIAKAIICIITIANDIISSNGTIDLYIKNVNEEYDIMICVSPSTKLIKIHDYHLDILNHNTDYPVDIYNCREYYTIAILNNMQVQYEIQAKNEDNNLVYNIKKSLDK
ncbi:hypothetical protein [Rickettsia endosymbiont of Cardiosporidium cionae]|uniref:hypothetical protein n=1 Tax=Rickettsia endosymbiont of Cardiosporidium cionae TaxID=2777155 RepID=UPI001895A228|nr:hypothetical protein [Rickettsia endosymbiont of Cardiosporidium cionae]KAF8818791.1 hypothetical protein IHI24_000025 [Rickettsia endosymbiont of Cardiosporidium cionae]